MDLPEGLRTKLRLKREEQGWNQADVAQLVGLTEKTIWNIENTGKIAPKNWGKLAHFFDIPSSEVFASENPSESLNPTKTLTAVPSSKALHQNVLLCRFVALEQDGLETLTRTALTEHDETRRRAALQALVILFSRDRPLPLSLLAEAKASASEDVSLARRLRLRIELSVGLAFAFSARLEGNRIRDLSGLWAGKTTKLLRGMFKIRSLTELLERATLRLVGTSVIRAFEAELARCGLDTPLPLPPPVALDIRTVLDLLDPGRDWAAAPSKAQRQALLRLLHPGRDVAWEVGLVAAARLALHRPGDILEELERQIVLEPAKREETLFISAIELAAMASDDRARDFAPAASRLALRLLRDYPGDLLPLKRPQGGYNEPLVNLGNVLCHAATERPIEIFVQEIPRLVSIPLERVLYSLGLLGLLHPGPVLLTLEELWRELRGRRLEAANGLRSALDLIRTFHRDRVAQAEARLLSIGAFPRGSEMTADYVGACAFLEAWGAGVVFAQAVLRDTPLSAASSKLFHAMILHGLESKSLLQCWGLLTPALVDFINKLATL